MKRAPKMRKNQLIIVNLSGRGDKDVAQVADEVKLRNAEVKLDDLVFSRQLRTRNLMTPTIATAMLRRRGLARSSV